MDIWDHGWAGGRLPVKRYKGNFVVIELVFILIMAEYIPLSG